MSLPIIKIFAIGKQKFDWLLFLHHLPVIWCLSIQVLDQKYFDARPCLRPGNLIGFSTGISVTKPVTMYNTWNNRISDGCVYAQIRKGLGMHLVTYTNRDTVTFLLIVK